MHPAKKIPARIRRHRRVRKRVAGTSARPRLAVFRSIRHIYAQIIDDAAGRTLVAASSGDPVLRGKVDGGNVAGAQAVGQELGRKARERGVTAVVFDRGGYQYHGRVKALAESARQGGLQF